MVRAWGSDDRILLQGPIGTVGYTPQTGFFLWQNLGLLQTLCSILSALVWISLYGIYLEHTRKPKKWSGHGVPMIGFSCRGP